MIRHNRKALISCLAYVACWCLLSTPQAYAQPGITTQEWRGVPLRMSSDVLHVRFRTARTFEAAEAVLPAGFKVSSPFLPPTGQSFLKTAPRGGSKPSAREQLERTFVVKLSADMSPLLASRWLMTKHADVIEFAEPWYLDALHNTPNDPFVNEQHYLNIIGALEAWDSGVGDPAVVMGFSDDGMDQEHEDLAPNIAINTNEIKANGVDDDGNGYIDDYDGYNLAWQEDNASPGDTRNNGNDGHGTKVAGLGGAAADNSVGIAGVGRRCRIFPIKASSVISGGVGYGYQSLIYAVSRGFKVVNCSWGTVKPASPIDQSVIDFCEENDVVVVASSGNHGDMGPDASWALLNYPAAYPGVIGVGETNTSDFISGMTGLGQNADVVAPCTDALTTSSGGGYTTANIRGSSFAAPMVTGMVGLIRSKYPALTVEQVRSFVRASTKDISHQNASYPIALPGRIDLKKAMTTDPFAVPAVVVTSVKQQSTSGDPIDRIVVGDTLALTFSLKNILAPVQALTGELTVSGGSGWRMRILNPDVVVGDFATGETKNTSTFLVVVDSIDETQAILQLNLSASNYIDHQLYYVPQPSPMAVFENAELVYSIGDNGLVAFEESPPSRRGLGFNWKPSFSLMSPSGFLLCEGGKKGLGAYNNIEYQSDFTPVKPFALPDKERSSMSDQQVDSSRLIGVLVSQRCTFPSYNSKTTVWTVEIKNTSGTELHDVAAGYYLDIDIGPRGVNNAIRLAPEAIPVTFAAEPSAAMVVSRDNFSASVVMATHTNNATAVAQAASGLFHIIVNDIDNFTDADRVLLLTSDDSIQTSDRGDVWGVIGMKFPGPLAPNDTRTFSVVVGVGANAAEASQNVMATLTDPQSVDHQMPVLRAALRPNPASDFVILDHPDGASYIQIIDALGSIRYAVNASIDVSTILETGMLAVGAYRCVVSSADKIVTLPLLVVR